MSKNKNQDSDRGNSGNESNKGQTNDYKKRETDPNNPVAGKGSKTGDKEDTRNMSSSTDLSDDAQETTGGKRSGLTAADSDSPDTLRAKTGDSDAEINTPGRKSGGQEREEEE